MKMMKITRLLLVVSLILTVVACGKTPAARFYTLSPMSVEGSGSQSASSNKHILSVGPITVAAYLDRSEIVTRSNATSIELAGFDRWAEPFEGIVASTLAENISSLLPSVSAIPDAWSEAEVDYQLMVKIKKFESDSSGKVQLNASWGILLHPSRKLGTVFESNIITQARSSEFDEVTIQMSNALAKLSEEIAAEIRKIILKPTLKNSMQPH